MTQNEKKKSNLTAQVPVGYSCKVSYFNYNRERRYNKPKMFFSNCFKAFIPLVFTFLFLWNM